MDFTRQPIIESIITPKEGCKLVVRSSKSSGQEEFFVDALEVVSFGNALFFRSVERPKAFVVPASDYEVLEVRETRMVLKNVANERNIKIGGGREPTKAVKETYKEPTIEEKPGEVTSPPEETSVESGEPRTDKRKDKRRQSRRRRVRDEITPEAATVAAPSSEILPEELALALPLEERPLQDFSALLTPPPVLISETIARYKENALFKGAFYLKEGETIPITTADIPTDNDPSKPHPEDVMEALVMQNISLESPVDDSFMSMEEEEEPLIPIEEKDPFVDSNSNEDDEPPYRFS